MRAAETKRTVTNPQDPALVRFLREHGRGNIVFLTGAGISAESGIPTFRGKEGYWTIGSRNYHPQEAATHAMFTRHPRDIWSWYLYRRSVCAAAAPNAAHHALARLERRLGDRFLLITQNIDGLHLAAGNTPARTWQIHGNVHTARCDGGCGHAWPIPEDIPPHGREDRVTDAEWALLQCPGCGGLGRPHVLWFDEIYDEPNFRFQSSLRAAAAADLLVVVGTSGATNLPMQIGALAARQGAAVMDVNPDENPFAQIALALPKGLFCQGAASAFVPEICRMLAETA